MWNLSYRPEVTDDVIEAVAWFDDKRTGLADEFLFEYITAIERIRDNPLAFAVAENGLRPCRVKRFSYLIHFEVVEQNILVVALMGGGRDDAAFIHRKA